MAMVVMRERERYGGLRETERRDGYGVDERERDTGFRSSQRVPQSAYVCIPRQKKKWSLSLLKN